MERKRNKNQNERFQRLKKRFALPPAKVVQSYCERESMTQRNRRSVATVREIRASGLCVGGRVGNHPGLPGNIGSY